MSDGRNGLDRPNRPCVTDDFGAPLLVLEKNSQQGVVDFDTAVVPDEA
jgi:hypothetical protein